MSHSAYFWAKTTDDGHPGCSIREHCLATAEVAKLLLQHLPDTFLHQLPEGIPTLVALHDVGKISPGFQTKCPQWKGPMGDTNEQTLYQWSKYIGAHAAASEWILGDFFSKTHGKERPWKLWAECSGAHHGQYNTISTFPYKSHRAHFLPQDWLTYTSDFIAEMQKILGSLPLQPLPKDKRVFQEWIIGLTEVADWISSNEEYFPASGGLSDTELSDKAREALQHIGFQETACVSPGRSWADLFPHAPTPRPLQQHLWELPAEPGTYIVEDAMGGGKTEAALGLAYHLMESGAANGLYFALPTQTTSNRIFERVLDFLQRAGAAVNERSGAWLTAIHGWFRVTFSKAGKRNTSQHRRPIKPPATGSHPRAERCLPASESGRLTRL